MTERRKSTVRHENAGDVAEMFACCDGVRGGLDGMPYFENLFLARDAWKRYRARSWELWERSGQCWPPGGAVAFDGLTETLWKAPFAPAGEQLAAARDDLAALEAFRGTPEAAEAEPHISTFAGILLAAIAELERAEPDEVPDVNGRSWNVWRHREVRVGGGSDDA